jgi:hypothetical protein
VIYSENVCEKPYTTVRKKKAYNTLVLQLFIQRKLHLNLVIGKMKEYIKYVSHITDFFMNSVISYITLNNYFFNNVVLINYVQKFAVKTSREIEQFTTFFQFQYKKQFLLNK